MVNAKPVVKEAHGLQYVLWSHPRLSGGVTILFLIPTSKGRRGFSGEVVPKVGGGHRARAIMGDPRDASTLMQVTKSDLVFLDDGIDWVVKTVAEEDFSAAVSFTAEWPTHASEGSNLDGD